MADRILNILARSWKLRRLYTMLSQAHTRSVLQPAANIAYAPSPYKTQEDKGADARPALFITSRFRTGSTFLWQLMNAVDGATCYYEPLNERVWVDEADEKASPPKRAVDPTHKGVSDYAAQYAGLSSLSIYHTPDWTSRQLWMDEQSHDWAMRDYLTGLIAGTDKYPVLQFNRVDFRLRWLRRHFPAAKILHLIRTPRAQWMSTLHGQNVPREATVADFKPYDNFYLLDWAEDLSGVFPILRTPETMPAYGLFYLIWRLSFLHGSQEADLTIRYEDLIADVTGQMEKILSLTGRHDLSFYPEGLEAMIVPASDEKWKAFASDEWFTAIEAFADKALKSYLDAAPPPLIGHNKRS